MRMRSVVGATAIVLATAQSALAQDRISAERVVKTAPDRALELTLAMGYSRGFGDIAKPQTASLTQMGQEGGALQAGLGYRLSPRFMLGLYGEGAGYSPGALTRRNGHVYGAAAGVQAQFHFMPYALFDPWLGVGLGWRGYWVRQDGVPTHALQGIDALRLQAGIDYRVTPAVSVSPLFSLSATKFHAERGGAGRDYVEIDHPESNIFVFAGLMGRFDIGSQRRAGAASVASR